MTPPDKRPAFLITFSLILALYHIIGALQVLQLPESIVDRVPIAPGLQSAIHLGWASGLLVVAVALVQRRSKAKRYAQGVLTLFILYSVARLLLLTHADYDRQRLPFLILLAGLFMLGPIVSAATGLWRYINKKRGF